MPHDGGWPKAGGSGNDAPGRCLLACSPPWDGLRHDHALGQPCHLNRLAGALSLLELSQRMRSRSPSHGTMLATPVGYAILWGRLLPARRRR